jgi:hypothetical protein
MSSSAQPPTDWSASLREGWAKYFDGSASPQFLASLALAIGVGIAIGVSLGGSGEPAPVQSLAARQAEERSILHIEELSARSLALEASLKH